jgi:hypothetical protein
LAARDQLPRQGWREVLSHAIGLVSELAAAQLDDDLEELA